MTRLSKQQICEGMEAGISEKQMKYRVYVEGKTPEEAIAIGPTRKRGPKPDIHPSVRTMYQRQCRERKAREGR